MKLTRCVKTGRSQCTVSGCPQGLSLHSIHQFYTFTKVHTKLNNNHCRFKNIVISTITYLHNCKGLWPPNLIRFVVNWSTNSRCCRNYFMSLVDQQTQEISFCALLDKILNHLVWPINHELLLDKIFNHLVWPIDHERTIFNEFSDKHPSLLMIYRPDMQNVK
jgi:hypothetical protein